jgi:hypothetical protein
MQGAALNQPPNLRFANVVLQGERYLDTSPTVKVKNRTFKQKQGGSNNNNPNKLQQQDIFETS